MDAVDWDMNSKDRYLAKNIHNSNFIPDRVPRKMNDLMVAVYSGYFLFDVGFTQLPLPVFGIA